MAVNLSVVGIFFNQSITPASGPGPYTLSSIMKAATSAAAEGQLPNLSAFTYGIDANLDATSFSATYKGPHSSPHFALASFGMNTPAFDTASAKFCISGASLCSGMLGMRS